MPTSQPPHDAPKSGQKADPKGKTSHGPNNPLPGEPGGPSGPAPHREDEGHDPGHDPGENTKAQAGRPPGMAGKPETSKH
jgi:hypothetical protein